MNREIISTERLCSLLKAFKELHAEEYHLISLGHFGSYARNEATPESDIDVVFQTDHPDLFLTAMLKQDIEMESSSGCCQAAGINESTTKS